LLCSRIDDDKTARDLIKMLSRRLLLLLLLRLRGKMLSTTSVVLATNDCVMFRTPPLISSGDNSHPAARGVAGAYRFAAIWTTPCQACLVNEQRFP